MPQVAVTSCVSKSQLSQRERNKHFKSALSFVQSKAIKMSLSFQVPQRRGREENEEEEEAEAEIEAENDIDPPPLSFLSPSNCCVDNLNSNKMKS